MIFRCLSIIATKSKERNKGKTTNQENSGTDGVGVDVEAVDSGVGEEVGLGNV
jgi:hypothetical protein